MDSPIREPMSSSAFLVHEYSPSPIRPQSLERAGHRRSCLTHIYHSAVDTDQWRLFVAMAADDRYVAFKPMSWAELTSEAEDLRVIWQRLRDQVHELKDHANAGISDNRRITGAAAFELAESSLTSEGDATDSQIAAAFNANVNNLNYMALHDLKTRIRKRKCDDLSQSPPGID